MQTSKFFSSPYSFPPKKFGTQDMPLVNIRHVCGSDLRRLICGIKIFWRYIIIIKEIAAQIPLHTAWALVAETLERLIVCFMYE